MTSRWFPSLLLLILASTAFGQLPQEQLVAELPVQPLTRYRLTFDVKTDAEAAWELRILDHDGSLPHFGAHQAAWQRIRPGQTAYEHRFLTPPAADRLQLVARAAKTPPTLENVRLDVIDGDNLVLNSDFAAGLHNDSGWGDRSGATLVEEDGRIGLRIVYGGYALTDPIPVRPGGRYAYPPDASKRGTVLVYNQSMLRIGELPEYHHVRNPVFTMPEDAAWVRLLFYSKWEHIEPSFFVTDVALVAADDPAPPAPAPPLVAEDEIVLPGDATLTEERAARELQHWLHRISGRQLPVLATPSAAANRKIHVGTRWAERFPDDQAYLAGTDGYAIRRQGDSIYILAAKPAGCIHGVIRFLEDNTDIIWARPLADIGVVYSTREGFDFAASDCRSKPAFPVRMMSFPGGLPMTDTLFWMSRLGINSPVILRDGFNRDLGAAHAVPNGFFGMLYKVQEFEKLKDSHPEFFPMIDGKRMIQVRWINPCFSNPDVVDMMAEGMRRSIEETPGTLDFIIAHQADTWRVCACPDCMRPIALPDGGTLTPSSPYSEQDPRFFSTRMFMMLNQVAERLTANYPEARILTHAYIFTAEPPAVDVHPAIKPQYAAYPTRNLRTALLDGQGNGSWGDHWERRFRQWLDLHANEGLSFFGYYNLNGFSAVADAARSDMRELAKAGGFAVHNESSPDVDFPNKYTGNGKPYTWMWDADAIERWVLAKLMWDPEADPEQLRDTYTTRTFREAAPAMRAFYRLIRKTWHDPAIGALINCHTSSRDLFKTFIVDPGLEEEARALLVEADNMAVHPHSKIMIQRTLARFDSLGELLNREVIPWVPESTHDWRDPVSPHWEKAVHFDEFKKVDDWRVFNTAPADYQTRISAMTDGETLYFRVIAFDDDPAAAVVAAPSTDERFPNGDRAELVLADPSGNHTYFAIGPNGNRYDAKQWRDAWDSGWEVASVVGKESWTAMVAIPLSALDLGDKQLLTARFGRVYRLHGAEREESTLTGASLYNRHDSFWTRLSIGGTE